MKSPKPKGHGKDHPLKDLAHQSLVRQVFPETLSRSQKRKVAIIEAAIRCYASVGVDRTSYQEIADQAHVSRPLLFRYFKDKEEVFHGAVLWIRNAFQKRAIDAVLGQITPREQLIAYVRTCFEWAQDSPDHVTVWYLFAYYCRINQRMRDTHTELVGMGTQRIESLLRAGYEKGQFRRMNFRSYAKLIQTVITGALFESTSENIGGQEDLLEELVIRSILKLIEKEGPSVPAKRGKQRSSLV